MVAVSLKKFFFFKQKTAYEIVIGDWSSDVCSSDLVYKKFGKRLPHSSSAQRRYGKKVKGGIKNAKAGDLICYSGHVAIYMGNNKIVHASNSAPYPRGGIKISNNARYRKIVTVRRIVQ